MGQSAKDGNLKQRSEKPPIERKRVEDALKQAEASSQRERDQLELRVRERTAGGAR
jgi:hypothetical protein